MKISFLKNKKVIYSLLIIFLATWILCFFWENTQRHPAAVESKNFFDYFQPSDTISTALSKEVIESIKIQKVEKQFQIDIRNFFVKSYNQHLCEIYDQLTFTFEAEGMATSGERPSMKVTGPCEVSAKTKLPIPIKIPVADIYKLKPFDTNISFQINPKVAFAFRNVSESWPEYWVLSKVEFTNTEVKHYLIIDRKEIYKLSSKPLIMEWN